MPVFVKHGGKNYQIPDDVLKKSAIPKELFERKLRELEAAVKTKGAGLGRYDFLDFSDVEDEPAAEDDRQRERSRLR